MARNDFKKHVSQFSEEEVTTLSVMQSQIDKFHFCSHAQERSKKRGIFNLFNHKDIEETIKEGKIVEFIHKDYKVKNKHIEDNRILVRSKFAKNEQELVISVTLGSGKINTIYLNHQKHLHNKTPKWEQYKEDADILEVVGGNSNGFNR